MNAIIVAIIALSDPRPGLTPIPVVSPTTMFRGGPAHIGLYEGGGRALTGLAWRAVTDGDVVSSPAVENGTVYVGSDDGYLYALDLTTGTRRWRAALGSPVSSSPAVGGGLVYATARDGSVFARDARTGAPRWRVRTRALLPFPWGHESGDYYLSSPTLAGGVVVVGAGDGAVYALNATTGVVKWRAQTGGRIRSSPAVVGNLVYVGAFDGNVYCFDFATGAQRWRSATEGVGLHSENYGFDRRSIQSSPAVANGRVYVGARDGFLYALDAATGERRWRADHQISWVNSSAAVADGIAYVGSSDRHFVQAVDSSGKELWRANAEGIVWSSPAVAGPVVYFGDGSGRLYAVDRASGKELWTFRTGAAVFSSPVVAGPYVVFGSSDGAVYALRADSGPPVQRAVFFDSTDLVRSHVDRPAAVERFLVDRGYQSLDSAGLTEFLTAHAADRALSVVVFAIDYVTTPVMHAPIGESLLRKYLEAGGKIVWTGVPPGLFPEKMPPGRIELDWSTPGELTDVPHDSSLFDMRGVAVTPAGGQWGLAPRWRDAWSVAPAGVTTVLGMDEWGLAAAWEKRFSGPEGTGFVRVPPGDPFVIYLAAEYRQGRGNP